MSGDPPPPPTPPRPSDPSATPEPYAPPGGGTGATSSLTDELAREIVRRRGPRVSDGVVRVLAWRRAEWMALAAGVMLVLSVAALARIARGRSLLGEALTRESAQRALATHRADSLRALLAARDHTIDSLRAACPIR